MKTFAFLFIFSLFSINSFSQQGIKIGVHGGIPLGVATDTYASNFLGDVDVLFHSSREFQFGATAGFSFVTHEDINGAGAEHLMFLPVGGMAQVNISFNFALSADIGYGIVLSPDNVDGGLYFAPKGHIVLSENLDIVLAYRGLMSNDDILGTMTIGLEYGFY